jgi:hypothetical protein
MRTGEPHWFPMPGHTDREHSPICQ